jgi:hypothetical protein
MKTKQDMINRFFDQSQKSAIRDLDSFIAKLEQAKVDIQKGEYFNHYDVIGNGLTNLGNLEQYNKYVIMKKTLEDSHDKT